MQQVDSLDYGSNREPGRAPGPSQPAPPREPHPAPAEPAAQKRPSLRVQRWLREHRRTALLLAAGLVLALGVGLLLWLHLRGYESTDDAQVDADISAIGARVTGTVTAVRASDNQRVRAGDVLVELDDAEYRVALAQA